MSGIELDVSELLPPEPMHTICAQLPDLQHGQFLHIIHRREPVPLYQILSEQAFDYLHVEAAHGVHHIWIWHQGDEQAQQQIENQSNAFNRT